MEQIIIYLWPVFLCLALGYIASIFQAESMSVWYPFLVKSSLTPLGIVFPVVWSVLYILMGISMGRILNAGYYKGGLIWTSQLIFNFLWSILFFTCRMPLLGFIDIIILDALTVLYIINVYNKDRVASLLFIPYIVWLLLATYLNLYIMLYN